MQYLVEIIKIHEYKRPKTQQDTANSFIQRVLYVINCSFRESCSLRKNSVGL